MKQRLAESIVDFLSFSDSGLDRISALSDLSSRQWDQLLLWLDDTGLSFYFLQRLKERRALAIVPTEAVSRLERNFAANQDRADHMWNRFDFLNREFAAAGVRHVALKGLTLVPEFCSDASLRHQGDFDYLVDEQSLSAAKRVLLDAGYRPKEAQGNLETIFVTPRAPEPSRTGEQYSAQAAHAIELHLDIWHTDVHRLPSIPNLFSVDRAETHQRNTFSFVALAAEDAFLLQIVHACSHLFTHWIRMSSLYEIGYFLCRRASDDELWTRIAERVGHSSVLKELVVVVTELVEKIFEPPIPTIMREWRAQIRPATRVWIEHYARNWAFCDLPVYQFNFLPRTKFALFLLQQYRAEARNQPSLLSVQPLAQSRLSRIARSLKEKPSRTFDLHWWRRQLLLRRVIFHALADLRYLLEIPRWLWLTRRGHDRASNAPLGPGHRDFAEF